MFKSKLCVLATLVFFATNVTIIVLSWIIMAKTITPAEPLVVTGSTFDDSLKEDWFKVPFVDLRITVRNATVTSCPQGYEPLWARTWPGLSEGCLINFNKPDQMVVDRAFATTNNLTCDIPIAKQGPILMDNFVATGGLYGFEFCAKRGGLPFMNVTRVEPETLLCPNGTEPCSNFTSPENTICYPPENITTSCPLTDILITPNVTEVAELVGTGLWTAKPKAVDNKWYTLSSTKVDKMPITWTTLDYNPCRNSNQVSTAPQASFYPLEVVPANCTLDPVSNSTFDDRFVLNPHFQVSENKL